MMAEENASLSNNDCSPLGEVWRYGCPNNTSRNSGVSGHTTLKVSTGALGRTGLSFLRIGSSRRLELPFGLRPAVPGNARNVPGEPTVTVYGSLSHLGRAVTARIGVW